MRHSQVELNANCLSAQEMYRNLIDNYVMLQRVWFNSMEEQRRRGIFIYRGNDPPVFRTDRRKGDFVAEVNRSAGIFAKWESGEKSPALQDERLPFLAEKKVQEMLEFVLFGRPGITRFTNQENATVELNYDEQASLESGRRNFHDQWERAKEAKQSLDDVLLQNKWSRRATKYHEQVAHLYRLRPMLDDGLSNSKKLSFGVGQIKKRRLFEFVSEGIKNGQTWIFDHPETVAIGANVLRALDEYGTYSEVDESAENLTMFLEENIEHFSTHDFGFDRVKIRSIQNSCKHTDNRSVPQEEIQFASSHELPPEEVLQTYVCAACKYINSGLVELALGCLETVEQNFDLCNEETKGIWHLHHGRLLLRRGERADAEEACNRFKAAELHFLKSGLDHCFLPHARYLRGVALRRFAVSKALQEEAAKTLVREDKNIFDGIGESCLYPHSELER